MYKTVIYIISTILIVAFATQIASAQQGSAPVGVNFILVNFNTPPTSSSVSVEQAPLKYNKDFAFSMQIDDSHITTYTHGFPVFEGGDVNGTTYPGFFYSDGCGNAHSFKMSSSTYIFSQNNENGPDVHDGSFSNQLTWAELDTLYNHNWGIYNHGVNSNANTSSNFINYSINRNKSYIRRKLWDATPGGVVPHVFVNPNGSSTWTQYAFDNGNISALNQNLLFPIGNDGGDVNDPNVDWTQPQSLNRKTVDDINVPSFVNQLALSSTGGANYWCPIFSHNLSTQYAFGTFVSDFTTIANTYGINGLDNILMTTDEEIQNYLIVRDATTINYVVNGTTLLITFSGNVPDDLRYYTSSIVIESDATINNIIVDGATDYTYNGIGTTDALINVNWDGRYIIPAEYLADSMVTIATNSPTPYNCWIAMDYVITLENGNHKDSLRQLLCNIPNIDYDEGFCDCHINLQPSDTTILLDSCIYLFGVVGEYTYEWYIGDSLIDTTQDIYKCPIDTTQYNHIATNTYGCSAEDSIMVNVHSFTFDLGHDTSICEGSCDTLFGPANMRVYQWYAADTLLPDDTISSLIVCPTDTTQYALIATDTLGFVAEDSITINILAAPPVYITPVDSTINYGDCIDLFGPDTNFIFNWFMGDSLLVDDTTYTINTCPEDTTLYTLIVTDTITGCSAEDSTYVYINFLTFDLGNDTTICQNECVTLTGPPDMVIYRWWVADTIFDSVQVVEVCPMDTTIYSLWVENEIGATAEDSITISTRTSPTVEFENDSIWSCYNNDVDVSVIASSDVDTFSWNYLVFDSVTTINTITIPNVTTSGEINVYAYAENGCSSFANQYLSVYNYPPISTITDTSLCRGDSIMLYMTGGTNYLWIVGEDTISTNPSIYVNPTETTDYIAQTAYDDLLCYSFDTVTVQVFDPAIVTIDYDTNHVCRYETIELIGKGTNEYFWMPGEETDDSIYVKIIDTTTISVIGTTINGCVAYDTVTFYPREVPVVTFTGLLPAFCITDPLVELTGSPPGGDFSGDGVLNGYFVPGSTTPGIQEVYYNYRIDENSCYGRDTNTTVVYDNDGIIDLGSSFSLTLYDSAILDAGAGFNSYLWTTGSTSQSIKIFGTDKPPGTYEYVVIGIIGGCSTRGSIFITFGAEGYSDEFVKDLVIYPNPNTGKFVVKFRTTEEELLLRVTNLQGKPIYENEEIFCLKDCITTVELDGIPQGIYILQIITPKGISTTKVVLK